MESKRSEAGVGVSRPVFAFGVWRALACWALSMASLTGGPAQAQTAPALPPSSSSAPAAHPPIRFPHVVTVNAHRVYGAKNWTNYAPYVYYAHDAKTGEPLLASDGLPEPFITFLHHSALGVFSGRVLLPATPRKPHQEQLPQDQQASIYRGGVVVKGSKTLLTLRYCCEAARYTITPRQAFPEADWQAMDQLVERLRLFTSAEKGIYENCDLSVSLAGRVGRVNPALLARWRVLYLVDEYQEVTSACQDHKFFGGGAWIGDPLGDGTRLVMTFVNGFGSWVVVRVRESDGRPIGPVPRWLKVVDAEAAIALRDRVRAQHQCPPLTEAERRYHGKDPPKDCRELVAIYAQAALEQFTGRKKPRMPPFRD